MHVFCECSVCYMILYISLALTDIKVFVDGIYLINRKKKKRKIYETDSASYWFKLSHTLFPLP